ncbi:uncharacterized protein LOC128171316 [Crassostrea angulata]|uniref:uncharacterized protein LOC128171316 n=1 Tax=Magallana angulata TaxID=2784310 RepID=UPI0022B11945|nr:uncharacterized protein LOC128171316 [Crassostrea angulata]
MFWCFYIYYICVGFFNEFSLATDSGKDSGQDPPPFVNPFNHGNSLFETPYSGSINAMGSGGGGFLQGAMSMNGGGGRNGLPSMYMKDGTLHMGHQQQCLKNIVCPTYCHETDKDGCETCPCGPANGMLPPGYTEQHQKKKPEEDVKKDSQCLHTLICMLSCKDGYQLGKKGGDGCQTCKCLKKDDEKNKNNTSHTGQKGQETLNNKNKTQNTAGGSNAQGPFGGAAGSESGSGFNPMFPGTGMGSASASGAGMPSPFGGGASGGMAMSPFGLAAGGDRTPGKDCFGPECSAKNGMKLLGGTRPSKDTCPSTSLCIKTCKHDLKLGPKGSDGCPSCACVKSESSTTAVPSQKTCDELLKCMMGCQDGYKIGSVDTSGCPVCSCKSSPAPITTPASMSSCREIMELCVQNCRYGYQLIPSSKVGECTSCLCQPAPTMPMPTTSKVTAHHTSCQDGVVSCMTSCRYGYFLKASENGGCPRCHCLPPRRKIESSAVVTSKPNVYNILKNCPGAVHCMLNCKTGYVLRTGSGSECPQCTCQAVAVQPLRCTSALFCHRGCVLGYKHGDHGCPSCSCISPSEIGVTSHTAIFITSSVRCNAHFSCSKHCDFGYRSGDNSCPTCQCLIPIKVSTSQHGCTGVGCHQTIGTSGTVGHVISTHQSGSQAVPMKTPHHPVPLVQITHVSGSHGEVGSYNTISMLMKYCTNVAHCVNSCHGGFSLTGSEAGRCPACTCTRTSQPTGFKVPHILSVTGMPVQHHSHQDIHRMCPETFRCGEMCADGFTLKNEPGNPCPSCNCITGHIKVTASPQTIHPIQTGSHVMVDTGATAGNVPMGIAGGGSSSLPLKAPSPSLTVPGIVPSVNIAAPPSSGVIGSGSQGVPSGSAVHFNILQGPGGENIGGPQVAAGHALLLHSNNCVGPACSAKNGFHKNHVVTSSVKQTPPNRCARIIHCVLTCHSGYKLTDKDEGGCPGCDCLPSK